MFVNHTNIQMNNILCTHRAHCGQVFLKIVFLVMYKLQLSRNKLKLKRVKKCINNNSNNNL